MKSAYPLPSRRRTCAAIVAAFAVAIAGWGSAAQAAEATASATASVVRPITIDKVNDLRFGSFSTSSSGQTVVISPGGSRVLTGAQPVNSTFGAANFTVRGEGSLTYCITLPNSATIETDGG